MVTVHGPRGGDRLRRAHTGVYTGKGTIAFIASTCALICSEDRRAYLINGGEGGPVGGDLSAHVDIAQWSLACCLHARCLPFALACFVITHLLVFLRAEIATSAAVLVTSNQDFKHVLAQVLPDTSYCCVIICAPFISRSVVSSRSRRGISPRCRFWRPTTKLRIGYAEHARARALW